MTDPPSDVHLFPWVISMMRTWETQTEEVEMTEKVSEVKESLTTTLDQIFVAGHTRYQALDGKLDQLIGHAESSKLTPVYALILLAVTFWAGCQVGGL